MPSVHAAVSKARSKAQAAAQRLLHRDLDATRSLSASGLSLLDGAPFDAALHRQLLSLYCLSYFPLPQPEGTAMDRKELLPPPPASECVKTVVVACGGSLAGVEPHILTLCAKILHLQGSTQEAVTLIEDWLTSIPPDVSDALAIAARDHAHAPEGPQEGYARLWSEYIALTHLYLITLLPSVGAYAEARGFLEWNSLLPPEERSSISARLVISEERDTRRKEREKLRRVKALSEKYAKTALPLEKPPPKAMSPPSRSSSSSSSTAHSITRPVSHSKSNPPPLTPATRKLPPSPISTIPWIRAWLSAQGPLPLLYTLAIIGVVLMQRRRAQDTLRTILQSLRNTLRMGSRVTYM